MRRPGKVDTAVDAGRLALRAAIPCVCDAERGTKRIALSQRAFFFDEHTNRRPDSFRARLFRCEPLCFTQTNQPFASFARRNPRGNHRTGCSLLGAVFEESDPIELRTCDPRL